MNVGSMVTASSSHSEGLPSTVICADKKLENKKSTNSKIKLPKPLLD